MATIPEQISALNNAIVNLQGMIQGVRYQGLFYGMIGSHNVFGCKVTNELYPSHAITSSSVANPTVFTVTGHGLPVGTSPVEILGHTGTTPAISGLYTATYINANAFSIPVNVSVGGGATGTMRKVSMVLSVNGQASGDTAHLNPDGLSPSVRPEQYWNLANVYGEVFLRDNVNVGTLTDASVTIATAPGAGYHRYDAVYSYITSAGSMIGISTGTAVINASTPTLPAIPQGTLLLAQVEVKESVTGIISTLITDMRNFTGRLVAQGMTLGSTPIVGGGTYAAIDSLSLTNAFISGELSRNYIENVNATYTALATDTHMTMNRAGTVTLTLPAASTSTGREFFVRTIQAQTVVSATSNVIPLIGGSAGTAILAATAGKWAKLVSDGVDWEIVAAN